MREIRRINLLTEETLGKSIVTQKERADKAEARLAATAAQNMLATIMAIVLPPVLSSLSAVITYEVTRKP